MEASTYPFSHSKLVAFWIIHMVLLVAFLGLEIGGIVVFTRAVGGSDWLYTGRIVYSISIVLFFIGLELSEMARHSRRGLSPRFYLVSQLIKSVLVFLSFIYGLAVTIVILRRFSLHEQMVRLLLVETILLGALSLAILPSLVYAASVHRRNRKSQTFEPTYIETPAGPEMVVMGV